MTNKLNNSKQATTQQIKTADPEPQTQEHKPSCRPLLLHNSQLALYLPQPIIRVCTSHSIS